MIVSRRVRGRALVCCEQVWVAFRGGVHVDLTACFFGNDCSGWKLDKYNEVISERRMIEIKVKEAFA